MSGQELCFSIPVYQYTGVPVYWYTSIPVYRYTGVPVYQYDATFFERQQFKNSFRQPCTFRPASAGPGEGGGRFSRRLSCVPARRIVINSPPVCGLWSLVCGLKFVRRWSLVLGPWSLDVKKIGSSLSACFALRGDGIHSPLPLLPPALDMFGLCGVLFCMLRQNHRCEKLIKTKCLHIRLKTNTCLLLHKCKQCGNCNSCANPAARSQPPPPPRGKLKNSKNQ